MKVKERMDVNGESRGGSTGQEMKEEEEEKDGMSGTSLTHPLL